MIVGSRIVLPLLGVPVINEVTTTLENPPKFVVLLERSSRKTNEISDETIAANKKSYADLRPYLTSVSVFEPGERLLKKVETLARAQSGWEIVSVDSQTLHLEAEVTTRWLRFKDDVVIELRSSTSGFWEIHMRSRSRMGKSDLGANAKRIRSFLALLKEQKF